MEYAMTVKDVMTASVFSLRETDTLSTARSLMNMQRIRHVPIVGTGKQFIGLITHRDLLSATISWPRPSRTWPRWIPRPRTR